ncbi:DUF1501 domain-containing protein [Lacipirellula limnantheis]|uniref:Sulfatase n=1 Tax=Lacipirellula limnantheis TaxID=2528024 RepID=A0A517U5K3_9BACT|nr:DUF1501 domain-containing protein [Lacipirellula limnantheis]QDT75916.1 hypothetical protein I41_51610 [Lacipirellula limnantheis]
MPAPLSRSGLDLLSRRQFLGHTGIGLGGIALAHLLHADGKLAHADGSSLPAGPIRPAIDPLRPHAPRAPHFAPRAKNVLMIYCSGAISQLDTFDYKPELVRRDGQPMPGADQLVTFQGENGNLARPRYKFRPRGECGKMTSDLLPRIGELADDLCFIHSLTSKTNTHGPGENFMATGYTLDGFPSMGAWVNYALGSENEQLPAFVAIPDPRGVPQSGSNHWAPGFLPAVFQGTAFNASRPVRFLDAPVGVSLQSDAASRDFLKLLNDRHLEHFPGDTQLAARIASYELAAKLQRSLPDAANIDAEAAHTLKSYGANDPDPVKAGFARNCILARRLVERGVRFVQLFNGAYAMGEGVGNWDGHKHIDQQYAVHGPILDQPAAALVADLKQRGLLADTLVVFCTEFGRMPTFQKGASGRDHNPKGFTAWLAGAGVRAPFSYGATDEFGYQAVENVATVYDFHATILHLLGLDHTRLSFYHNGIERRLTDVHGEVIHAMVKA